ncbi:MAG: hypothetical protein JO166_24065 [Deltaproteobacteria bacterium]|nr:hypothetical protein [Deltaproteobacteria bacterium]
MQSPAVFVPDRPTVRPSFRIKPPSVIVAAYSKWLSILRGHENYDAALPLISSAVINHRSDNFIHARHPAPRNSATGVGWLKLNATCCAEVLHFRHFHMLAGFLIEPFLTVIKVRELVL